MYNGGEKEGFYMINLSTRAKRNQRLTYISHYFSSHPNQLVSLSRFSEMFKAAKSSLSEDIDYIRSVFEESGIGTIETIPGVQGGMIFRPQVNSSQLDHLYSDIKERMAEGKRILPGNYVYLTDMLQDPTLLDRIAKAIASKYQAQKIDAVVTIETKGIGLAVLVGQYLNVPYVVARRSSSDMDGSTISVNYVSGSYQRVAKMELSKASIPPKSRVLIVDDFLRNGGTMVGLMSLMEEVQCKTVGICVFVESLPKEVRRLPQYDSLLKVEVVYNQEKEHFELQTEPGSFFK